MGTTPCPHRGPAGMSRAPTYNPRLMHLRALPAVIPPRLQVALGLFGIVIVVGTGGYLLLTDMSFVDALYQTVTTLSTVGFRELATFDTKAKLFTVVLILFGVGTVLYTLSLVMEQVLGRGDLRSRFYARRMTMQIAELSGHYILCGFGRVGRESPASSRNAGSISLLLSRRRNSTNGRGLSATS